MSRKWVVSCTNCKITKQCGKDNELREMCQELQRAIREAQKWWIETQNAQEG